MQIAINQFQHQCLQIFSTLQTSSEEIVITDNGKPIAKIVPFAAQKSPLFGRMSGTATILSDIEQPLAETWNVEQ